MSGSSTATYKNPSGLLLHFALDCLILLIIFLFNYLITDNSTRSKYSNRKLINKLPFRLRIYHYSKMSSHRARRYIIMSVLFHPFLFFEFRQNRSIIINAIRNHRPTYNYAFFDDIDLPRLADHVHVPKFHPFLMKYHLRVAMPIAIN